LPTSAPSSPWPSDTRQGLDARLARATDSCSMAAGGESRGTPTSGPSDLVGSVTVVGRADLRWGGCLPELQPTIMMGWGAAHEVDRIGTRAERRDQLVRARSSTRWTGVTDFTLDPDRVAAPWSLNSRTNRARQSASSRERRTSARAAHVRLRAGAGRVRRSGAREAFRERVEHGGIETG